MENKPLNILIVAAWYPDDKTPTSGSFVEEQACMLAKQGHRVTVLHPYLLGNFSKTFYQKHVETIEERKQIQVLHVGVSPVLPGFRKLAYHKLYLASKKALQSHQFDFKTLDVIHSHSLFMGGYVAMHLAQEYEQPFFHTEHTSGLIFKPEQYNKSDQKIIKAVYAAAQKVFFVSHFALEKTLAQSAIQKAKKFIVLPNVIDDSFFDTDEKKPTTEHFKYLAINNLIPRKQVDLLLLAWKNVIQTYPNAKLTIAGEGPEKRKLTKLVVELEIADSVSFLPKLSRLEVKEQISQHHVLVSTSALETFGLTVAEAQAMGKPVVVTDSGGVRDIVEESTGIICQNSSKSITDALLKIQDLYTEYNFEHIQQITHTKFSSDVIYSRLMKQYATS